MGKGARLLVCEDPCEDSCEDPYGGPSNELLEPCRALASFSGR